MRRLAIYSIIERDGAAETGRLAEAFGVSSGTVARDIKDLHDSGLVQRVRGGAVRVTAPSAAGRVRAVRMVRALASLQRASRAAVALEASAFIAEGSRIALSGGPISLLVAHRAARTAGVCAITYSLAVAEGFRQYAGEGQALVLTGGVLDHDRNVHGALAARNLRSVRVDVGFVEADGVDRAHGLSNLDGGAAELNRAIVMSAERVVFLAEHSAWGRAAGHRVATLDGTTLLVVDSLLAEPARRAVRDAGARLVIAH
ncbi:DeoR/GlpR family DNA-binding transcription regulator [Dactylosporangium sp. CA-139066]|uniref:DeoR/GlpR family DNA-binding transcription regulator n=1 Tax=Dactylosporangium sp. CA-139066 TaxID=3239930 RepID=UPI003D919B50